MPTDKPNVLCFVTDQHRADHIGCYGNNDIRTPHLDRLAGEGVRFDASFVANPVCMPNRASLFTGRYPKAHGVRENGITLSPSEHVLPELLRQAGYQTASFGKIHLAPFGIHEEKAAEPHELYESSRYWKNHSELPLPYYGFEEAYFVGGHGDNAFGRYKNDLERDYPGVWEEMKPEHALGPHTGVWQSWKSAIPEEHHYNTAIADRTIEFLESHNADKPFFAWCSFPDPHHPFSPPAPYCHQYDPATLTFAPARRPGELDDLPPYVHQCYEGKLGTGGLDGDVRQVTDDGYGEILAHTYGMVSMVDHHIGRVMQTLEARGFLENTVVVFLSDHGDLMGDHWLINKGPFLFNGLVRVPTIWRIPGQPSPGRATSAQVSAVDFCPTVLDLAGVPVPEGTQGRSYRSVLQGGQDTFRDWVYIEYDESYLEDRLRHLRSSDWSLTYYAEHEYGMLYDLRADPDELQNRWDDPDYRETRQQLLAQLLLQTSAADDHLPGKRCHA